MKCFSSIQREELRNTLLALRMVYANEAADDKVTT